MINLASKTIIPRIGKHKKSKMSGVFLQKAFDFMNHKILLSKPEHFGIRGMSLKLFQNYLMNQPQFVEIYKKKVQLYFQ